MTKQKEPWRGLTLGWGQPHLLMLVEGFASSCNVTLEPWPWVGIGELTKLYEIKPSGKPEDVARFLAKFDEHFAPTGYDKNGNCEVSK